MTKMEESTQYHDEKLRIMNETNPIKESVDSKKPVGVIEVQTVHKIALSPDMWDQVKQRFDIGLSPVTIIEGKSNTVIEIHKID